ncbi:hypothetical protein BT69DRAFT_1280951 [Atractiella rhizophila]|nr:hypothetical protein BT69DRAFT_1280951 [Atractiella rhizophila]
MSRASKATLGLASLFCVGTIYFVHFQQERESAVMYQGVVRDAARREEKKRARVEEFEEQKRLREWLERDQKVERGEGRGVILDPSPEMKVKAGEEVKLKGCTSCDS